MNSQRRAILDDTDAKTRAKLEALRTGGIPFLANWIWESRKNRIPESVQPEGEEQVGEYPSPWRALPREFRSCCVDVVIDATRNSNALLTHCRSKTHCEALAKARSHHFSNLLITGGGL